MKILLPFFFVFLNSVAALHAQSYSYVHYDTKDGLPSTTVYDISQDKDGFIWFATENGLSRFDGKNFKTYTTKDGLPDNSILKVHGDNKGRVYFTPFTHGLYYFYNNSFSQIAVPEKYRLDLSTITYFRNKNQSVFISGLSQNYLITGNGIEKISDKYRSIPDNSIIKIVTDTLLILQSGDSLYFLYDNGKIKTKYFGKTPADIVNEKGEKVILKKTTYLPDDPGEKSVINLTEDISPTLVYESRKTGIIVYDIPTGNSLYWLQVEKVSSVFIDNEGNFWISTLGYGVYRFPSFGFRNLNFPGESEFFSLAIIDQRVIAGADFSKMYSIPEQPDAYSRYSITDLSDFTENSGNPVAKDTRRNRIYTLLSEGNDLYIGADAFLLRKKGKEKPLFRNIFPVKDIDIAGDDVLVCTGQNVLLLNKQDLTIKDTLLKQRSTCGVFYQGEYYIGTLGGLIRINPVSKKVTQLSEAFPSFRSRIVALKRGSDDEIWIATSGAGLIRFKNDKVLQVFREENGLTSDICTSLFIENNLVWLGTNKGLNRIETATTESTITRFTSANGLGADFINTVLATDGSVFVGTVAGLTVFNKKILTEKSLCILHILQVAENNKSLQKDSAYSFRHDALNIRVDFTAISFKSAGDINYYYMLEGLDNEWHTTTANFINFASLPPDNYRLLLKAINKFGVESATSTLYITIRPPWWQTWFFRIAVIIISGLLIFLVARYYIRNIKRKEATKREFETRSAELEQKALQAQMNPHFIFNSLNSIQNFILDLDVEGANQYLTSFASLIRQTLENSIHPLITIASEIRYLETYLRLEKLRFRDKFIYTIEVDESIDLNNTFLPGMLLQPYIENSIRHGIQHRADNKGSVSLRITKTAENAILYTIKDNGVGRKKAAELRSARHIEYQSRGTFINEKRIAAINIQFKTAIRVETNDILDSNDEVTGTMVTVLIPPLNKQEKI